MSNLHKQIGTRRACQFRQEQVKGKCGEELGV